MDINITRKNIPSIAISKDLLIEFCKLLDDEYDQAKDNMSSAPRQREYKLECKREVIIRTNSTDFMGHYPVRDLKKIELCFKSENKKIDIRLDLDNSNLSDFIISGKNSQAVTDTENQIGNILRNHGAKKEFFHLNWKVGLPTYLAIAATVSLPLAIFFRRTILPLESFATTYILILIIVIGPSVFFLSLLVKWLFPKYETDYAARIKHRISILVAIIGSLTLVGLILSGIMRIPIS